MKISTPRQRFKFFYFKTVFIIFFFGLALLLQLSEHHVGLALLVFVLRQYKWLKMRIEQSVGS